MTRILLVDDHTIFRDGLKRLLHEESDLKVVAEAADGKEALAYLRSLEQNEETLDLVLLDINMRGRSGLDILPLLKQTQPALPVVVLSMYPAETYAVRALEAGASGYIAKDMDFNELIHCLRRVSQGGRYFPAEILDRILQHNLSAEEFTDPRELLSSREFEVMMRIVHGERLTDIGDQLHLSVKTISTYRSRILQKLNIKSNAELIRYALHHQLID